MPSSRLTTRTALATAIVTATALTATAAASSGLNGTWATTVPSGITQGKWAISFASPSYAVSYRGTVGARGHYTVSGNKITFNDKSGTLACSGPGVYRFKLSGNKLSFSRVSDGAVNCFGRREVLAQTFVRKG